MEYPLANLQCVFAYNEYNFHAKRLSHEVNNFFWSSLSHSTVLSAIVSVTYPDVCILGSVDPHAGLFWRGGFIL